MTTTYYRTFAMNRNGTPVERELDARREWEDELLQEIEV